MQETILITNQTKDKIMNNNKLEVVAEFVELPEGKKVEDIEEWFIRLCSSRTTKSTSASARRGWL